MKKDQNAELIKPPRSSQLLRAEPYLAGILAGSPPSCRTLSTLKPQVSRGVTDMVQGCLSHGSADPFIVFLGSL